MKIPIICINLPQHVDRRQRMIDQAKRLGIELQFFNAVNGNNIPKNEKFTCCRSHPFRASYHHSEKDYVCLTVMNKLYLFNSNLTLGEVGLALSILVLYHQLIQNGTKWAIILEDDVILDDDFAKELKIIEQDLKMLESIGAEFVYINDRTQSDIKLGSVNSRYYRVKSGFGFDGYLVSIEGMKKLCNLFNPLFYPVDLQIVPHLQVGQQRYRERNHIKPDAQLVGYKYHKNLVTHTNVRSTIHGFCKIHNKE